MRCYILFVSTLLFSLMNPKPVQAQQGFNDGEVRGRIVERESGEALPFVSVVLVSMKDTLVAGGAMSNDQGEFRIDGLNPGRYKLQFRSVSHKILETDPFRLGGEAGKIYAAGIILLDRQTISLNAAEVEAERSAIMFAPDRKTYSVEDMGLSQGASAGEILQQLPSVDVNDEGAITLRGNPNVTVLIDGKPSAIVGSDREAILEQLPASVIERIEVITQPGAKYDPDGTAGIINIITRRNRLQGFNGNIKLSGGNGPAYDGSISLGYKTGIWNITAGAGLRQNERYGFNESRRTSFLENTEILEQKTNSISINENANFKLGLEITPGKSQSIVADFSGNTAGGRDNDSLLSRNSLTDGNLLSQFLRLTRGKDSRGGWDAGLSWFKDDRDGQVKTNASFRYGESQSLSDEFFFQKNPQGEASALTDRNIRNNEEIVWTAQLDHEHVLSEKIKIDGGLKTNYRSLDKDLAFYTDSLWGAGEALNPNLSNRFIFKETLLSAYTQASGKSGSWEAQAGARFEQALTNSELLTTEETFENNYFSIFPSAFIKRKTGENSDIILSYTRRISRAGTRELNPFPSYSDPLNLTRGNPYLLPEYIDAFEIGYTSFTKKNTYSIVTYHRQTNDVIQRFREVDSGGVATTTFLNISSSGSTGIELIWQWKPINELRINQTINGYRLTTDASNLQSNLNAKGITWSYQLMASAEINKKWQLQLSGRYSAPRIMPQTTVLPMYWLDISIQRSVLQDKGSISLRGSDIFDIRDFRLESKGLNFESESTRKRQSRLIVLGFSYNFGKLEDRKSKRSRGDGRGNDMDGMDME
jgi:outer membrane receptor protein involved in Fe transport